MALPSVAVLEGFESLTGGSMVVLDMAAAVRFSSDLAQKHFETFFPRGKAFYTRPPANGRKMDAPRNCCICNKRTDNPSAATIGRSTLQSKPPYSVGRHKKNWTLLAFTSRRSNIGIGKA